MTDDHRSEHAYLAQAAAAALRAGARAHPNPTVGCVLVRDGEVVGTGVTSPDGGPHAEAQALTDAGERAAGATAYVTLEPCAHTGRTPPCADALRDAGVAAVVFVEPDPNPVAAGGAQRLRDAAIEVRGPLPIEDPIRQAVRDGLNGFLAAAAFTRPFCTLKLATTAAGALTCSTRRWLTGEKARWAVHRLRADADAVLVGVGTVLADDPRLNVRHVATDAQPRAVVLDTALSTPPTAAVVRDGTMMVTTARADRTRRTALADRGAQIVEVATNGDGHVDVHAAFAAVAAQQVQRVFAEPGVTLASALLNAGVVDRLVRHVALDLGADDMGALDGAFDADANGPEIAVAPGALPVEGWRTVRVGGAGQDLIVEQVPEEKAG